MPCAKPSVARLSELRTVVLLHLLSDSMSHIVLFFHRINTRASQCLWGLQSFSLLSKLNERLI
jgi:hypothetical protein